MTISIDFINISNNFWAKKTNKSDQSAIIRWPIVPRSAWFIVPPCGQIEHKCGSRKIYFRVCCYTRDKQRQQY